MGLLTNRVERSEIKPGDHIYTYRAVFAYSHHGSLSLSLSQDYLFVWFGISIACHCLWLLLLIVRVLFPNRFLFKSPALINYDLGYKSDALKTFKLMNCMALPFVEVSEIIE